MKKIVTAFLRNSLFMVKEEVCKGRRKLLSPVYFGGLYAGRAQNACLWEMVDTYI